MNALVRLLQIAALHHSRDDVPGVIEQVDYQVVSTFLVDAPDAVRAASAVSPDGRYVPRVVVGVARGDRRHRGRPKLPNNWLGIVGGKAWEWDETTRSYYLHSFAVQQPDLNWFNPELRKAALGEAFHSYYCTLKKAEWARYLDTLSEWEQTEYFSVL